MRTWLKPFAAGVFVTAALLAGAAAWSESDLPMPGPMAAMHARHHGDPAQHEAMFRTMAIQHLSLDAAQTTRLDALIATLHQQHDTLHGAGPAADLHGQLATFVQGNAFDRAGAQSLVDTKLQQVREGAPTVIASFGDFYDALRPDQQQKLRDFMAHHEGPGMHAHGHGPDRDHG